MQSSTRMFGEPTTWCIQIGICWTGGGWSYFSRKSWVRVLSIDYRILQPNLNAKLKIYFSFTSLLSGFIIFSVLGHISTMVGQDITELATQGPELVFVAYPQALSEMMPPALWSTMFFLCLFVLGQVSKKWGSDCPKIYSGARRSSRKDFWDLKRNWFSFLCYWMLYQYSRGYFVP